MTTPPGGPVESSTVPSPTEPEAVSSTDVTELRLKQEATEAARRDTEARFQAVFKYAPIGQIFSELGGPVSAVNQALAAMLGYQPEEMIGRRVADFSEPDEFDRIRKDAAQLLDGEDTVTAIRRFLRKDGGKVPVRVTSALLRDAEGAPRWWVSMVMNLTEEERARTELELAHAETLVAARRLTLLNAVVGAANDATDLDSAALHILGAVCRHFGWQRGALLRAGNTQTDRLPTFTMSSTWTASADVQPLIMTELAELSLDVLDSDPPPELCLFGADETAAGSLVLLPLAVEDKLRYAWVFGSDGHDLDDDELSLLRLIALETTRLVERQVAQERLAESEQRFRSVFAGSPLAMALISGETGTFSAVNAALCQLVGRTERELIGQPARLISHPDDIALLDQAAGPGAGDRDIFTMRLLHAGGSVVDAAVTLTWMSGSDGNRSLLAQLEDITARRLAEESLRRQAEEDSLTGLANRAHLNRSLAHRIASDSECTVLFIDLDGFKLINDSCGHEVGDEVLIEVAHRLRATVRPTDLIARLGGDEFVVVCSRSGNGPDPDQLAQRISHFLDQPITTTAGPVRVTASVGIADCHIPLTDPTELLNRADAAMYRAKRLGKDRSEFYDADLHRQSMVRSRTENALRTALDDGRFTIHYQPIIDLRSGAVAGFEALVRLVDEAGVLVSPEHFISVAEQSGLIIPMGSWVLRQACHTLADLRRTTGLDLFMAVNVAPSQVGRPDLVATVQTALTDACLPQHALSLELTESALLEADSRTLQQLNTLRSAGVQIALDDFGTGYSSLTYLRTFPVSHLKIDRSFVSGIAERTGDLAIVRAIAGMAADLGLGCVAEGVETEQQRRLITELGVPSAQGYLFARPAPVDQLYELLTPRWSRLAGSR